MPPAGRTTPTEGRCISAPRKKWVRPAFYAVASCVLAGLRQVCVVFLSVWPLQFCGFDCALAASDVVSDCGFVSAVTADSDCVACPKEVGDCGDSMFVGGVLFDESLELLIGEVDGVGARYFRDSRGVYTGGDFISALIKSIMKSLFP